MPHITTKKAFGCAVAPARGAVCALAFVVVVVGVVAATAAVAFGSRWMKFAQGGSCGVSQHVATSALDESRAITCDDEFNWFTKHKHALLSGGFYYGVSSVHYGYQDGACRDSEDVGGILLPVWRHPE